MQTQITRITLEEFITWVNLPENADKRFELMQGEIIEVPSAKPIHAAIIANLVFLISLFVRKSSLGFVFSDSVDFYLPNEDVFIPDVSFISKERQPTLPDRFEIAPDLAVEVVSPSNSGREILNKVESYIECGTKMVWVVYPEEKIVDVYHPAGDGGLLVRKHTVSDTLDGADVLPDFTLAVSDVFQTA